MTSSLFSSYALRDLALPNRVIVSPMCQYSAEDGNATDWHVIHLGTMTQSGAALVLLEATAVSAEGRITAGCLGLWNDDNEAALRRVLAAIRPHANTHIGVQLAHAGRKASSALPWEGGQLVSLEQGGWVTQAPSAVPQLPGERAPHALSRAEIDKVIEDFAAAAIRADRLGLDAIELHAAHGYLLHEFLSPVSNQRDDDYGGALENRMRLPLAVFDAVRAVWPQGKPLGVRVSSSDWLQASGEPSWTIDETVVLAQALKARGCDWIDASSGGISPQQKITLGNGYQIPFAERIKREAGITTIGVGLINDAQEAEAIVADGRADLVALARGMLWDPRWVWHAAAELGGHVSPPPQYSRSAPRGKAPVFTAAPVGTR